MMAQTDEQLVEAFQSGDSAAFDVLVERWNRKIHVAVYRVVGSHDEARDLAQEAFLRAYRAMGTFKREARFSSWLYQIALNLARDRLRRRRTRPEWSLEAMENATEMPHMPGPSAFDLVESAQLSRAVAAAVASLPSEQREVVVLKEYQGLTFSEIAEALEVPLSTVKTRLYRGLVQLRHRLEAEGIRSPDSVPDPQRRDVRVT